MTARVVRWLDRRVGGARMARKTLDKVFPDHWSFLLGEVALYCFVILVLTGIYLSLFFTPSTSVVTYDGSYGPLRGRRDVGGLRVRHPHQLRRAGRAW